MATNDIIRLTVRGQTANQEIVNVYHYKQVGAGTLVLEDLHDEFMDNVLSPLSVISSSSMLWLRFTYEQLQVGGIFLDLISETPSNGAVAGDQLPPNVCYTFTFVRKVRGNRNGYKRFAGVPESWQNGGELSAGHATEIGNVASALGSDLTTAASVVFRPGVLHKFHNGQPVDPPVFQEIATVAFTGIGTQNTRKIGRGS